MSKCYITTPIYYVNASPHIGHAYTTVAADAYCRFKKLTGCDTYFLTGTDEHGEKIKKAAEASGKDPQVFVDEVMQNFKKLWQALHVEYSDFIRTTEPRHIRVVQKVIETLTANGDIYKSRYRGFYCRPCEAFWTEMQVKEAGGCPDCKREVEEIIEENFFFRLSKYEGWLKNYLKENPDFIRPKIRYNEVVGFLENNSLEDLCISRPKERITWGIEFPGEAQYVVYVWFDALINYISALGYGENEAAFSRWWPAEIHFMAKDIIRHHAVFWPIMLRALGVQMPKTVFAHGWWKINDEKMSKSRGNIVNPFEFIEQFGVDSLRYFLLREVTFGADGNFSWDGVATRVNNDLANDLGNLVYRVLNMSEKYFPGDIPVPSLKTIPESFGPCIGDQTYLFAEYAKAMDEVNFSGALEKVWKFVRVMNKYIEETKPWELKKSRQDSHLHHFIWSLLQGINIVAAYVYPVMPQTAENIFRQLGGPGSIERLLQDGLEKNTIWRGDAVFKIRKENPLFPRIDVNDTDDHR